MVPIGNRPMLWHIMKLYSHYGFRDFILCLGYKGEVIKDYFRNFEWEGRDVTVEVGKKSATVFHNDSSLEDWRITLAETGMESMTATRIKRIERYIREDENFLLTYGDGLGNVDILEAVRLHEKKKALVTLTAVHPPGRFGDLVMSDDGQVDSFNEKPQTEGGWINGGFMVIDSGIFQRLASYGDVMFEKGPLDDLAAEGLLAAYQHKGFWQPMDTYQEYLYLNKSWDTRCPPWKIWE